MRRFGAAMAIQAGSGGYGVAGRGWGEGGLLDELGDPSNQASCFTGSPAPNAWKLLFSEHPDPRIRLLHEAEHAALIYIPLLLL